MASGQVKGKYYLRSLHQEIDLYDRKLAHLLKYEAFASDKERDAAAQKLSSRRNLLVLDARQLVDEGIEYKVSEIPRSLRTPEQLAEESSLKPADPVVMPTQLPLDNRDEAPAQTFSQLRKEIDEYVKKRRRGQHHSPVALKLV